MSALRKGTFVAEPNVSLSVAYKLLGFSEDMAQKGHTVRSQVLEICPMPAPDDVARALTIAPEAPVVFLKRLRSVDGHPFLVDVVYVRYDLCPGLDKVDFTDASLFHVLETKYGLRVVRARRTLRIVTAEAWIAKALGVQVGEPLHLLTDLAFVENGEAILYAHVFIHDRNSEFTFDLVRAPEAENHPVVLSDSTNPIPRSGSTDSKPAR